jgi:hypothetical protein
VAALPSGGHWCFLGGGAGTIRTMTNLDERFGRFVPVGLGPDECWPWQGGKDGDGYGVIRPGGRRTMVRAHRVAFVLAGGVAEGMHVHHRCKRTDCVNPNHLEAMPLAEHKAAHRGRKNQKRERWTKGGTCRAGHDLNTYGVVRRGSSYYACVECLRLRLMASRQKSLAS